MYEVLVSLIRKGIGKVTIFIKCCVYVIANVVHYKVTYPHLHNVSMI